MATVEKPVDVVIVGFGWTGAIMAIELAQAGLNVLALERGEDAATVPNWAYPKVVDEIAQSAGMGCSKTCRRRPSRSAIARTIARRPTARSARSSRELGSAAPGSTGPAFIRG